MRPGAFYDLVRGMGGISRVSKIPFWGVVALAAFIHLLTVFFSTGFHHFDEHFQVLEFMNYLRGKTPGEELAWEFAAKIRPWLLPWFFFGLAELFSSVGIENPFTLSLLFRSLSAALGFYSSLLLCQLVMRAGGEGAKGSETKTVIRWVPWVLLLTWFLPYMHVRTSSENYSSSLFIIALAQFFLVHPSLGMSLGKGGAKLKVMSLFTMGLLMGLSFHCRYQMGVPVFFVFLWMCLHSSVPWRAVCVFLLGLFATLGLGAYLDQLAYGFAAGAEAEFVLAPWEYLRVNLFEGKAAEFSRDPIWFFLTKPFSRGVPPISWFLGGAVLLFWWREKKNAWSWVTLSFFVIHTLVSHKEVRFLNFVYVLSPFFLAMILLSSKGWMQKRFLMNFAKLALVVNLILVVFLSFRSARQEISLYKVVYDTGIENVYLVEANSPFLQTGLIPRFYLPKLPSVEKVLEKNISASSRGYYFVEHLPRFRRLRGMKNCSVVYSSLPEAIVGWVPEKLGKRTKTWGLFRCGDEV